MTDAEGGRALRMARNDRHTKSHQAATQVTTITLLMRMRVMLITVMIMGMAAGEPRISTDQVTSFQIITNRTKCTSHHVKSTCATPHATETHVTSSGHITPHSITWRTHEIKSDRMEPKQNNSTCIESKQMISQQRGQQRIKPNRIELQNHGNPTIASGGQHDGREPRLARQTKHYW